MGGTRETQTVFVITSALRVPSGCRENTAFNPLGPGAIVRVVRADEGHCSTVGPPGTRVSTLQYGSLWKTCPLATIAGTHRDRWHLKWLSHGAPSWIRSNLDGLLFVPPEPQPWKSGTGTFGRVHLVKEKAAKNYFALKVMSIPEVIRLKQEQHVHNEKSVLMEVNHPFLVKLFWTSHDDRFLYMLMEYVPGGELFSYLRNRGRFPCSTGLFYATEIVCAIDYLHCRDIVYRDLKPENILLDRDGHIKLTDFGFAKKLVDRTWTLCGTPEYLAPEVIQSKGHGRAVDWWALGILIFEMVAGFPPFFDDNPFGIYQKILAGRIDFPRYLDFSTKDLIKKLLVVDRTKRLGNMKNGANDVKQHRWFRAVDWDAVPQRKLKPPIVPKLGSDGDTSNFETYSENDCETTSPVSEKDLEIFKNF
uniref:cAMP-dependent protein kinase catalytic subunit PRKX n=1 Tax=Ictidomys tridecemlineatus TaxID=43179 RepID=UPI001A9EE8D5|nr:cAMP-dependent protein kinase catalytic subunit PRKX [Ictidomys tridecemlineatus]